MRKIELPFTGPRMAIAVGNDVFVTSYAESQLVRMPWPSCARVQKCTRIFRPRGIVYSDGRLYVACYGNPVGRIVCVDPETLEVLYSFKAFRPRGIDVWRDLLVVTQVNRGQLVLFDVNGRVKGRRHGFREPRDVCVYGDVAYVASTSSDEVMSVNLVDGTRRIVNTFARPNGVATNGGTTVTSLWNAGRIMIQTNGKGTREYAASRPCMVSYGQGKYIVCDDGADCMYVIDA